MRVAVNRKHALFARLGIHRLLPDADRLVRRLWHRMGSAIAQIVRCRHRIIDRPPNQARPGAQLKGNARALQIRRPWRRLTQKRRICRDALLIVMRLFHSIVRRPLYRIRSQRHLPIDLFRRCIEHSQHLGHRIQRIPSRHHLHRPASACAVGSGLGIRQRICTCSCYRKTSVIARIGNSGDVHRQSVHIHRQISRRRHRHDVIVPGNRRNLQIDVKISTRLPIHAHNCRQSSRVVQARRRVRPDHRKHLSNSPHRIDRLLQPVSAQSTDRNRRPCLMHLVEGHLHVRAVHYAVSHHLVVMRSHAIRLRYARHSALIWNGCRIRGKARSHSTRRDRHRQSSRRNIVCLRRNQMRRGKKHAQRKVRSAEGRFRPRQSARLPASSSH